MEKSPKSSSPLPLNQDSVIEYLYQQGILATGTPCHVEVAGDGNINWVRRVRAEDGRSWIIKQAREQLEKFPQYRADTRRILVEAAWMEEAGTVDLDHCCPKILGFDPEQRVLILEDLGLCPRLDDELLTAVDLTDALATIGGLLGRVHQHTQGREALAPLFVNDNMRDLHFAHIFDLPFAENDFPLPEPVRKRALELQQHQALRGTIEQLHDQCRTDQSVLVHADPQPGNILLPKTGAKLLDAEIAHLGLSALDPGILLAHVALSAIALQNDSLLTRRALPLWEGYRKGAGEIACWQTAVQIAGVEILRRTIGAARVASVAEVTASLTAIETGCAWLLAPAATMEKLKIQ